MSAPEPQVPGDAAAGMSCAPLPADIIELAPFRERTQVLKALAARRGLALPASGWIASTREALLLCVRPERWLLLTAPAAPAAALAVWRSACAGCAAAIELGAGLTALHLRGAAVREVLARGCRLDLHPQVFVPGRAAATSIAQVAVTLAALPTGWLLLTPSSTAQHLREWLASTARPFGFAPGPAVPLLSLAGERAP